MDKAPLAERLDILVHALACAQVRPDVLDALMYCKRCRNHLLYLLSPALPADDFRRTVTSRLKAMGIVHERHRPDTDTDTATPRIEEDS